MACQQELRVSRSQTWGRTLPSDGLTGSHPLPAEKPLVPQPGFDPDVMSLNPEVAFE